MADEEDFPRGGQSDLSGGHTAPSIEISPPRPHALSLSLTSFGRSSLPATRNLVAEKAWAATGTRVSRPLSTARGTVAHHAGPGVAGVAPYRSHTQTEPCTLRLGPPPSAASPDRRPASQ